MVTALVAGCALLCWPGNAPRVVAAGIRRPDRRAGRWSTARSMVPAAAAGRWVMGLVLTWALVVWVAAGPAVGTATSLLLLTVSGLAGAGLRRRRNQADLVDLLATVRMLAREVRSGAQPQTAVSAVATACRGRSASMLEKLAMLVVSDRGDRTPRSGGASPPAGGDTDLLAEISGRLAAGWALSARYGVPWVGLIDALAADLEDRVRASSARASQVSGPRVSGYVLAMMPALGLLLGAGMGADPVRILLATGAGHLMLLIGCTLTCVGLWWTARIVRG